MIDVGTWERKSLTGKGHILDNDDSPSLFKKRKIHIKDCLMKMCHSLLKASGLFISGFVGWRCLLITSQSPAY